MYYVLNFSDHSFVTCSTDAEVVAAIRSMAVDGVDEGTLIEVVNCFSDDTRQSGAEFLKDLGVDLDKD